MVIASMGLLARAAEVLQHVVVRGREGNRTYPSRVLWSKAPPPAGPAQQAAIDASPISAGRARDRPLQEVACGPPAPQSMLMLISFANLRVLLM